MTTNKKKICKYCKGKFLNSGVCSQCGSDTQTKPKKKEWEEEYWEMVYKHVDPFRKKGDKPIKEYVVYCDKDCHKEWLNFISHLLSQQKQEIKEKIEKMRRTFDSYNEETWVKYGVNGYNQALDDILKLL